jgi:hypothetical protein
MICQRRTGVGTPISTRGARFTLQSVSGRMAAVIYRAGCPIGELHLGEGIEVWSASEADKSDAPKRALRLAGRLENGLSFTGWYFVPGMGLAAIYGAKPPEN